MSNSKTCRLCLRHDEQAESLLPNLASDIMAVKAVTEIFNMKIDKEEGKPTDICNWCKDKLLDLYLFYLRVQSNEKKLERDAVVPKIKSDPDANIPLATKPISAGTVIIIDSDDDEEAQKPVDTIVSDKNAKTEPSEPVRYKSIMEIMKSDKKLVQPVKVKIEKCPSPILKRRANESIDKSPSVSKKPKVSETPTVPKLTPTKSIPSKVESTPSTGSSKSTKPTKPAQSTPPVPVSNFIKTNFNNFAEKLLCLKKNFSTMTDTEMIKVFYDLKCGICEMELDFNTFQELSEHYEQDHDTDDFKLECCSVKIPTIFLVTHIKHHLGLEKQSLKQHIQQLQSMFFCNICGKSFAKEHWYQLHVKFDHNSDTVEPNETKEAPDGLFSCQYCDQSFSKPYHLKSHVKLKHLTDSKNRVSCYYCDEKFGNGKKLQIHLSKEHADKPISSYEKLECKICQKPFNQRSFLESHIFSHMSAEEKEQLKKVKCNLCKFTTYSAHRLKVHLDRTHAKSGREFKCTMCQKTFCSKANLLVHQVSHLDKDEQDKLKPHKCPHCDKRFLYASEINGHINTFHRCNICSELLTTEEALEEHRIEVHNEHSSPNQKMDRNRKKNSGKFNFTCEFCDKNFRQEETYKAHVQEWHLGGYLYECKWCPKKYNDKRAFQEHTKNLHNDKM